MNDAAKTNGIPTVASLSHRSTESLKSFAALCGERFLSTNHGHFNAEIFDSVAEQRTHAIETLKRIAIVVKSRRS